MKNQSKKITKLEDLPHLIPLIHIKDLQRNKEFDFGNNVHDTLVLDDTNRYLYYYNSQNGDGSSCGDYNFAHRTKTCMDDEFYSRWVEMVDMDSLVRDYQNKFGQVFCVGMIKKLEEVLSLPILEDEYNKGYRFAQTEMLGFIKKLKEKLDENCND